jgi:hypothetical protein
MKTLQQAYKGFAACCIMLFVQLQLLAQESPKVEINGNDVGSWFSRNWIWVVGIVLLLVIFLLFSGSSSRKTRTTVVRRDDGTVTRSSTVVDEDV